MPSSRSRSPRSNARRGSDTAWYCLARRGADLLNSAVGLLIMVLCGLVVGWQWHRGAGAALLAVALLLAVAWPVLLVAVFFPLSVRRYRNLSR